MTARDKKAQDENGQALKARVERIYSRLHRLYRLGAFEEALKCYLRDWPALGEGVKFYVYDPPEDDADNTAELIKYSDAVKDLYKLVLFLERNMGSWVAAHAVEVLKIKNLIYEVKDYSLDVPPELGEFFVGQAKAFRERYRRGEIEDWADELRGETCPARDHFDARARVIKVQIIAALCGVNHLYRLHMHGNYEEALGIVQNIEVYVRDELPRQHEEERESFGLLGLTMYLKGRLLSAEGDYANAQKAYAQSGDAYVARLNQKDEFHKRHYITKDQYDEKTTVTLRRAALVSALGVGYLSFINSRISKALAALRVSRAALKQNVGAVYGAFTDLLFFACRRAEGSSDGQTMEEVVRGLEVCHSTLSDLVPNSHYSHRAGIELALALHYRARAERKSRAEHAAEPSEAGAGYYARVLSLLGAAVEYAQEVKDGHYKNQRLLAEALVVRSYMWRYLPEEASGKRGSNLSKSEEDARMARRVAVGNSRMECEALMALGAVQTRQTRIYKGRGEDAMFQQKFLDAQASFRSALTLNDGRNVRIEAVCYLKLAKLSLLDPSSVALAHDHFKRWKEIEGRVEHAYCHDMAREISKRLSEGGPLLIVDAESSLNYHEWENKLMRHLLNTMLTKLSEETKGHEYSEAKLRGMIVEALINQMKFKKSKAYVLLQNKEHGLLERLLLLNMRPARSLGSDS